MKAFVMKGYGGPEQMGFAEVPLPECTPGTVRIKVHAAGLNPIDIKTRDGMTKAIQSYKLPAILGNECAGTVDAVGDGVSGFTIGERVATRVDKGRMGALADYAVTTADTLAHIPDQVDMQSAAGLPLAGETALQALRNEIKVKPGDRILITGGAGGVGTLAIQIAKAFGARVITTASPRGRDLVKSLGADEVIDYTSTDFTTVLRDLDGAFDLIGGKDLENCFKVVRPGATVVSIAGTPEPNTADDIGASTLIRMVFWAMSVGLRRKAKAAGARYRFLFMRANGDDLATLFDMISAGKLRVIVDQTYPFEATPKAFEALESGHAKGKIIVQIAPT